MGDGNSKPLCSMLEDEMLEDASAPSNSLVSCGHKASRGANAGVMLFSSGSSPFWATMLVPAWYFCGFQKKIGCAEVRNAEWSSWQCLFRSGGAVSFWHQTA